MPKFKHVKFIEVLFVIIGKSEATQLTKTISTLACISKMHNKLVYLK